MPDEPWLAIAADPDADWRDAALCSQADPEAFFPEKGGNSGEAKRICRMCPSRTPCLEYAIDSDDHFGIWGGLSERERRKVKRQARTAHLTERSN